MTGTAVGQGKPKRELVKKVVWGACLFAVLWGIGCAYIYAQMRKPPEEFGRFMRKIPAPVAFLAFPFETMWMKARKGSVEIGDRAPDFTLQTLDGNSSVQLATLNRERPVVLIFGSYT